MAEAAPLVTLHAAVGAHGVGPLDLSLRPGEIVALLGASGSGKTTALRLIAGLETPAAGSARRAAALGGAGRTGYVFQSPTLAPWLSARANVALPLRLSGLPPPEADRCAEQALAAVGLGDRLDARPRQLSGGMAMRVSLARALAPDPALLLLDEPFAALDSLTRRALIEDLHRLWRDRTPRPAMVLVTHDVEEAAYMAGRLIVLDRRGRTVSAMACPGALPRPAGWRADPGFRQAVEDAATLLARTMAPPAAEAASR